MNNSSEIEKTYLVEIKLKRRLLLYIFQNYVLKHHHTCLKKIIEYSHMWKDIVLSQQTCFLSKL